MLYGLETGTDEKTGGGDAEVAELKMLRYVLGGTIIDNIKNE